MHYTFPKRTELDLKALIRPLGRVSGGLLAGAAALALVAAGPTAAFADQQEKKEGEQQSENKQSADQSGDAEMEQLPLDLPNPVFAGTPQDVPQGVNIDRARLGKRRPPYQAPANVKNVALGKPVTSSDPFPIIGSLGLVTDGDKEALDGRYVELAPGKQRITIDLEQQYEIFSVVFWHNHGDPRVYRDVVIQISKDKNFEDAKTIYNNDNDNSLGMGAGENYEYFESDEGELAPAVQPSENKPYTLSGSVTGRYVRMWSNGSTADDQNHYTEVEAWGRPTDGSQGDQNQQARSEQ